MIKRQTWDQALWVRLAVGRRHRIGGLLTPLLGVVLVVGVLPGAAQAEFGEPGSNGAQIEVEDAYQLPVATSSRVVTGRGFTPNAVAEIFQCEAGATQSGQDLHQECALVGEAQSDANGGFVTTHITNVGSNTDKVMLSPDFVSPAHGLRTCRRIGTTQCVLAAATYASPGPSEPTSQAEQLICFRAELGRVKVADCVPEGTSSTTTTTPPPSAEWEPAELMNVAHQRHSTAVGTDGRIYAMGGSEPDGAAIDSAEVFNPCGERTWSSLPPMPTARTEFAAAAGPDGRIYVIGGSDSPSGTPLASVDAYDPVSDTWSSVARLAVPRSDLAATTGPDGRIYAIGGLVGLDSGTPVPTVEAYDVATNQWEFVTPLSSPRYRHGAATGPDGRIYAIGGVGIAVSPGPVEYYTPGAAGAPGVWQRGKTSGALPYHMAVTAGPGGLIYAVGGSGGSGRTMSIYDPSADAWSSSTEALTTARATPGAAQGLDGRIYAIGGTDEFGAPTAVDGPRPLATTETLKVAPSSCPSLPPVADFNGDRSTDIAVFRPANGVSYFHGQTPDAIAYGAPGDIPVPGDYNGDKTSDLAMFRPSNGTWYLRGQTPDAVAYGADGDIPVPADYDGDHETDVAVFRPSNGTWYIRQSSTGTELSANYGIAGDVAVPADYDGDRKADIAVFRPSNNTWYLRGQSPDAIAYGAPDDIPVPADYDGDGDADLGIFRPANGTWYLRNQTPDAVAYGTDGDIPVPSDYNGDGRADLTIFRPSNSTWYLESGEAIAWGTAGDIPLPLPYAVRNAYFVT